MSSDANELLGKQEIARGERAVKLNIIEEYQLTEGINILAKLREMGLKQKTLSEILIEKGYIAQDVWEKIDSMAPLAKEIPQVEEAPPTDSQIENFTPLETMPLFEELPSIEDGPPVETGGLEAPPIQDFETISDPKTSQQDLDKFFSELDKNNKSESEKPGFSPEKTPIEEDMFLCPESHKNPEPKTDADAMEQTQTLVSPDEKTEALSMMSREQEEQEEHTFDFDGSLLPEDDDFQKARDKNKQAKRDEQDRKNWPQIPGYELISTLGKGGMGRVFKGLQISMQREVAIKVLEKRLSDNQEFVERFVRETRAVAQLSHENIIAGIDAGKTGEGIHYFVMEFIRGEPVSKILKREGKLPVQEAVKIALQIARALEHAHKHGIIHRDVKPENIMMDGNVAKLCDLGLVKVENLDSKITMAGMALGTPHYISPEQARGERDVDIRSDIYSLGASLYHMAAGSVPFPQSNLTVVCMMHATKELPDPKKTNPKIDDFVCRIIRKCTKKERGHRYQTPGKLVKDLEKCLQGLKGETKLEKKKEATLPVQAKMGSGLDLLPLDDEEILPAKAKISSAMAKTQARRQRWPVQGKITNIAPRPVMVRKKSSVHLVWGILAGMIVLVGVGYLIYPLVEQILQSTEKQKIPKQNTKSTEKNDNLQTVWKDLQQLKGFYRFSSLTEEKAVGERLEKYRRLLQKYKNKEGAVALIEKDRDAFRSTLEIEAKKSYRDIVRESEKAIGRYKKNDDPRELRSAYKILKSYPQTFEKLTSQGKIFQAKLGKAKAAIGQRVVQDLEKAAVLNGEKKYREAWKICKGISFYALPLQEDKARPVIEETQKLFQDCVAKAEKKYGANLNRKFHDAIFRQDYRKAIQICQDRMADSKYYGLLDRLTLMLGDLAMLEKSVEKLPSVKIDGRGILTRQDFIEAIPELAASDRDRQMWVQGMLFCQKHYWKQARECFSELSAERGQRLCLDYVQARLDEIQARKLWKKTRKQAGDKKYLLARKSVLKLQKGLRNTAYVKKKRKQIDNLRKEVETGYLKRYAAPLFYRGRFSKFPSPQNDFAFSIHYDLASRDLQDFFIADYHCQVKVKKGWKIDFDDDNGLFEAHWKGKLRSFERMSVKVKFTGAWRANVGLSLYKQPPLERSDTLERYLYLVYYDPNQMCRSEIFNKAKVYKDYANYQEIFAKKDSNTYRSVLCLTEGKAGTLPIRTEQLVKKKSERLRKKEWKLSVKALQKRKHKFDFFTCKCDRFNTGYFGLYANSKATFSNLTIAGKLERSTMEKIVEQVLKNRKTYLAIKAYWEDY